MDAEKSSSVADPTLCLGTRDLVGPTVAKRLASIWKQKFLIFLNSESYLEKTTYEKSWMNVEFGSRTKMIFRRSLLMNSTGDLRMIWVHYRSGHSLFQKLVALDNNG